MTARGGERTRITSCRIDGRQSHGETWEHRRRTETHQTKRTVMLIAWLLLKPARVDGARPDLALVKEPADTCKMEGGGGAPQLRVANVLREDEERADGTSPPVETQGRVEDTQDVGDDVVVDGRAGAVSRR